MTLNPNALTTLEVVKDELSILDNTQDSRLERYINLVSTQIESHCNRSFFFEASRVEKHRGSGTQFLVAQKRPILEIISITIDQPLVEGPLIEGDGFELQAQGKTGEIFRVNGWPWRTALASPITRDPAAGQERDNITLTHDCGFVTPQQVIDTPSLAPRTLPEDLEDAAVLAVVTRANAKGVDRRVKSERLLSASVSYIKDDADSSGLPPSVVAMLAPHCDPVIA